MAYTVKEIYYTLQGEGAQAGRAAVFCRFAGCNLWSGLERDRTKALCRFCDTNFIGTDGPGGGRFERPQLLSEAALAIWPNTLSNNKLVVCTGGEPLLPLDDALVQSFHDRGFEVAVETNGTQPAPAGLDWTCVSPKGRTSLGLPGGDELKLVFPQPHATPDQFEHLAFRHFFLQPMDGPMREANTRAAVDYCLKNPRWRLSLQTHKYLNIP